MSQSVQVFIYKYIQYFILAGIIFGAIAIRWITADFEVIFGYDAWWFFRHTQEIYDNNFIAPQWDTLSHFPPGRPVDYNLGWSYTIAIFYAMVHPLFPALTLMKFAGLFVTVFAALSAIPAYLLGRMITNRWGGLVAATCAVIPFAFLSVSVAGYPDSDSAVVFYSFLAILTTFYAVRKANKLNFENAKIFFKSFGMYLPYLAPALLAFWLFSLNWKYAFYIYFILLFFIPLLILFRFLEGKILLHERGYLSLVYQKIVQNRNAIFTIVLLGLFGEAISLVTSGSPYNARPLYDQVIIGLAVTRLDILGILIFSTLFTLIGAIIGSSIGRLKGLLIGGSIGIIISLHIFSSGIPILDIIIVNPTISELQPINLFSTSGFEKVITRLGVAQLILGLGIVGVIFFKFFKKREVITAEYFGLVWIIFSLILLNFGTRFSLLASVALAIAAGLVIGNFVEFSKSRKDTLTYTMYAVIVSGLLVQVFYNIDLLEGSANLAELSDDWIEAMNWLKANADENALIATWWDSGHAISGYTGLKVHTDGAHCSRTCIPYNFNTRTIDMGVILSTSEEKKSIDTLQKYTKFSAEECRTVSTHFEITLPAEACAEVSEVYVIASSDLIRKFTAISYFASFDFESNSGTSLRYYILPVTRQDESGNLVYGDDAITIVQGNNQSIPYANIPDKGISDKVVSRMISFDDEGNEIFSDFSDFKEGEDTVDGLLWVHPSKGGVILMFPDTEDRMLTKLLFLHGKGLEHFQLVYQNSEVKIYKVTF